ncbi:hypothetical protein GIX45_05515 [Erwinia sp. CPCC 100877]|nr:hypothetical protein [Erwinia sp. CPCC 100877]
MKKKLLYARLKKTILTTIFIGSALWGIALNPISPTFANTKEVRNLPLPNASLVQPENLDNFNSLQAKNITVGIDQQIASKNVLQLNSKASGNVRSIVDIDKLNSINDQLRTKYLNRAEYYSPQEDLTELDNSFIDQAEQDITLYANFKTESFGIESVYFVDNPDRVFESMLKNTQYGIDHGYFSGDLTPQSLDSSDFETIQIKLIVPKGTKIIRFGNDAEPKYMIPRENTFEYTDKTLKIDPTTEYPQVYITANLVDRDSLTSAAREEQDSIQEELTATFHTDNFHVVNDDFIKLVPLGLNAGNVIANSREVALKPFTILKDNNILSDGMFESETLILTNGYTMHTEAFDRQTDGESFEYRRESFEKKYEEAHETNELGNTVYWPLDETCTSIVSLSHYSIEDFLSDVSINDEFAATTLHEFFHHLIFVNDKYKNIPMFKDIPDGFVNKTTELKNKEIEKLVELLNNPYAKKNWEEYICEAFLAKNHPKASIQADFQTDLVETNRFLDNLFDHRAPSIPNGLKTLDITGESVKLTFSHSNDEISVDKYNLYQDGKLVKSVETQKDAKGLSYANPGDYQSNIEVTIEKLTQYTEYNFQVTAVDEAGNESNKSQALAVKTKDTEAPKIKGSLIGNALSSSTASFSWAHPTDNAGVKKIKLCRTENTLKRSDNIGTEKVFELAANSTTYIDSTLVKGKSYSYYLIALDEAGNESKPSNRINIKTNDDNDKERNEDQAKDTNYSNSTLDWSGMFDFPAASFQISSWFLSGGNWLFGSLTSVLGSATSSLVNLSSGTLNQFIVTPMDENGNALSTGILITVNSVDKSAIETQDSSLYTGQVWNETDNFVSALDENGKIVPLNDKRVSTTGTVDTSKAGNYKVEYSFKGEGKQVSSVATITVKEDKSSIKTKDITLYVGQTFNREDAFVSATDKDGNPVPWESETITSNGATVDTSKPGVTTLKYTYKGDLKNSDSSFKVTVKEDKSSIKTKDITLYVGQTFNREDAFVSATDKDGNPVPWESETITSNDATVDTSKPGVTTLKYTYKGDLKNSDSSFKVTVKEDKSSIKVKDLTFYAKQFWNKTYSFVSATDEDGCPVDISDERILVNETVDLFTPGIYKVKYSFKGKIKTIEATATINIKDDKSTIKTKDSSIYAGQTWDAADNFVSVTDEEGDSVDIHDDRIRTSGVVDSSKPGTYKITYAFIGKIDIIKATATIIVKEDKSTIKAVASTIYVGQAWNKANNFVSATDEDGHPVAIDDARITVTVPDGPVDTSKPSVYYIIYRFKGISKTIESIVSVSINKDKTTLELQDIELHVGQTFDINSPFKNVIDKDGNKITAEMVEWYYIDDVKTKELDTSKPGTHRLRIVYLDGTKKWKYSDSCKVTVKE